MTARVLVVEDAEPIRTAVAIALTEDGHDVRTLPDGDGFERELAAYRPDLVLLDVMLPGRDGFELLSLARETSNAGVILLTARDAVEDRLHGLRTGADDYVVKPFAISELLARIDAVLRRTGLLQPRPRVTVGDLTVDIEARTVQVADKPISLTRKEFDVLAVLAAHHGRVVPREQVALYAWQSVFEASSRTMDVHVASLRAKLGRPELVQTIRGVGYRLGSD